MRNETILNLAIFAAFGLLAVAVPDLWWVGVFMGAVAFANLAVVRP